MPDARDKLATLMKETIADRVHWTYDAVRPLRVLDRWYKGEHVEADCSFGVKLLCKWAGVPDPTGRGYDEYGNSQSLWAHLQHLDGPGSLLVGDIVTFGVDGDEHAAMVLERGSDPLLWSFGHQGAPNTYRLSYDRRPKQYLRNPVPHYVPTKEDVLRKRTGWFAWMAWHEGEGDWRPYGKRNKKVRPHVARVIPLSWWRRRAKFLFRRKKGDPASVAAPKNSTG